MARGRDTGETCQTGGTCKWREVGILGRQVRQEAHANDER